MADLDDFFAKKDRKKSKSVKKFSTTDEVTKKLDEPKQKSEVRPKKDRPPQEGDEGGRKQEEEEWKEYEEPVKDYTGLKIQVLQGGAGPEQSQDLDCQETGGPDNGKGKGPWNKPDSAEAPPPPPAQAPAQPAPRAASGAYVPPVARNRPEPVVNRRQQQKFAPDIHNDDYFPVLGAAANPRRGGWSTAGGAGAGVAGAGAGGAGAAARGAQSGARPLALGNQFTGLQDDS